jgi:hypothetical protein
METIGDKLRRFLAGISTEAKRTSGMVQAKMELNSLQQELDKRERTVGRKISQLNRRGVLKDRFILEAMREELEALADCERRIDAALRQIQGLAVFNLGDKTAQGPEAKEDEAASSLDSFDVS